jgi:hypothetical protein
MPQLPRFESNKAPEGHYQFRITKLEVRPFTYQTKSGKRTSKKIYLECQALGESGEHQVIDSMLPWEDRYGEFLKALHVEHSADIELNGSIFEGDIKHEIDRKNPSKSYARIVNITAHDDDIPFD